MYGEDATSAFQDFDRGNSSLQVEPLAVRPSEIKSDKNVGVS